MNHSFKNTDLPARGEIPTVFLPGWAFDGTILQLFNPSPSWIYPEVPIDPQTIERDLLRLLDALRVRQVRIVGWSMGAMLGLEFASRHQHLVNSLDLVSFRRHWPDHEMKEIKAEYSRDPATFLRNFYRKCFLGDKTTYRKFCITLENVYLESANYYNDRLQRGLEYLASYEIPCRPPPIAIRLIHGEQDIIAPAGEMPDLPGAAVEVVAKAGHTVFLQEDSPLQTELRKQIIQAKFSRAADSYDSYAKVQAEVARRLAIKLASIPGKSWCKTILEIGCGTGNFTTMLVDRFPGVKILSLDFSPEMIAQARRKINTPVVEFLCTDGELFLKKAQDRSFDLVVSNGSLQWFGNIENTFSDISRILTPQGMFFCSIFGPGSLAELAAGLHYVLGPGEGLVAESFPSKENLQVHLATYFNGGRIEEEFFAKTYRSVYDLLLHIKKTGTAGWHQRLSQPLTPSRVSRLDAWFTKTYGACRTTYQILFLQGGV